MEKKQKGVLFNDGENSYDFLPCKTHKKISLAQDTTKSTLNLVSRDDFFLSLLFVAGGAQIA